MNPTIPITTTTPMIAPITVNVVMPQNNITDYAAWAGFVLSLLLGIFELWKYWNDKGKLKIKYGFDIEIVGSTLEGKLVKIEPDKTFWSVDISNIGSKDIIFNQIVFSHTNTKRMSILTQDYNGQINRFTLKPGNSHSFTISNELINPKMVKEIIISDATGRTYKKKVKYYVSNVKNREE